MAPAALRSRLNWTRYCRYRAGGLVTAISAPSGFGSDQSLHVFSGFSVLPERVENSSFVPAGTSPSGCILPQKLFCFASRGLDVYVPLSASEKSSRYNFAGWLVAARQAFAPLLSGNNAAT